MINHNYRYIPVPYIKLSNYKRFITYKKKLHSIHSLKFNGRNGGGERVRTDGLLRARQALSQLSYTPLSNLARIAY